MRPPLASICPLTWFFLQLLALDVELIVVTYMLHLFHHCLEVHSAILRPIGRSMLENGIICLSIQRLLECDGGVYVHTGGDKAQEWVYAGVCRQLNLRLACTCYVACDRFVVYVHEDSYYAIKHYKDSVARLA